VPRHASGAATFRTSAYRRSAPLLRGGRKGSAPGALRGRKPQPGRRSVGCLTKDPWGCSPRICYRLSGPRSGVDSQSLNWNGLNIRPWTGTG